MAKQKKKSGEQKTAEAEVEVEGFRKDLGPFVKAVETTRMPMVFTNGREPDNPIIFANNAFLSLTGYDPEELLGQSFPFLMASDLDAEGHAKSKAAFKSESYSGPALRYRRKDGTVFWASLFSSPVRDESGEIVQHFASLVDLTLHRHEESRLRFFLDELDHRTRNMLVTVQAIARQTLRGVADKAVVEGFESRLLALGKAHGLLGRKTWKKIGLRDVINEILQLFGLNDRQVARFSVTGEDVLLPAKAALSFAMVFHELAANAVRYGALSNDVGRIDILWQIELSAPDDLLWLFWRESGGPPVTLPTHRGFGTRLIESGLAQELNGEVRLGYEPTGVVCQITMPVPGKGDGYDE